MRARLLSVALAAAAATFCAGSVQAGALASSDLNISQLFLVDSLGAIRTDISVLNESRTGTAASNYNGVEGTGIGSGSISSNTIAAPVDVKYRCAGICDASVTALYGGTIENNTTTKLTPPPQGNFAIGDMLISGSALGGAVTGLTRADASAIGGNNAGGANATILNTATLVSTFTTAQTFSGRVGVTADSFLSVWIQELLGETASAGAGQNFSLSISCTNSATNNCGAGWTTLNFSPDELNPNRFVSDAADNEVVIFAGTVFSDSRTFVGGTRYNLSINQASNSTVSTAIPEPASIALVGLALFGLGALRTRKHLKL
jgi:PEP-CTERM motif